MTRTRLTVLFGLFALTLAGCGDEATLPEQVGVGPDPKLPAPRQTLFPKVKIAPPRAGPRRCKANARRRPFGCCLCQRARPSALAHRPAEWRRARCRDQHAHTASLGLSFYSGKFLPQRYGGGAFIGQHGS